MPYHNTNTLRAIPTLRPAWMVFGPSATDRLIGDLRRALDSRPGYAEIYAAARAKLGQANRIRAEWRRVHQSIAFRNLNAVRAAMRANAKAIAAARAGLLAAGMTLAEITAAAPGGEAYAWHRITARRSAPWSASTPASPSRTAGRAPLWARSPSSCMGR